MICARGHLSLREGQGSKVPILRLGPAAHVLFGRSQRRFGSRRWMRSEGCGSPIWLMSGQRFSLRAVGAAAAAGLHHAEQSQVSTLLHAPPSSQRRTTHRRRSRLDDRLRRPRQASGWRATGRRSPSSQRREFTALLKPTGEKKLRAQHQGHHSDSARFEVPDGPARLARHRS